MKTSTTVLRRFATGIAVATALVVGFATPASAASVTTPEAPQSVSVEVPGQSIRVTLGKFIYVTYTKGETSNIGAYGDYGKLMAVACAGIPHAAAKIACGLIVGGAAQQTGDTFKSAKAQGRCAQIRWAYALPPFIGSFAGASVVNC